MVTRIALVTLVAFGLLACGGSVVPVDDGKTPAPAGTTPSKAGGGPPASNNDDPGNDLPQRSAVPVPTVLASSYDQSCSVNDDCAPMVETKDCDCACPNAAINKRDADRAAKDLDAHRQACVNNAAPTCGVFCANPKVLCDTSVGLVGTCRLIPF
jgi:hypothetical protein